MDESGFSEKAANLASHIIAIAKATAQVIAQDYVGAAVMVFSKYWKQILIILFVVFVLPIMLFLAVIAYMLNITDFGELETVEAIIEFFFGDYDSLEEEFNSNYADGLLEEKNAAMGAENLFLRKDFYGTYCNNYPRQLYRGGENTRLIRVAEVARSGGFMRAGIGVDVILPAVRSYGQYRNIGGFGCSARRVRADGNTRLQPVEFYQDLPEVAQGAKCFDA